MQTRQANCALEVVLSRGRRIQVRADFDMDMPLLSAAFQVIGGGVLVFIVRILTGSP